MIHLLISISLFAFVILHPGIIIPIIRIILKFIPIEVYYLINKVERFYHPFRRTYEIITKKYSELNNEDRFQIIIKVINNTIDP